MSKSAFRQLKRSVLRSFFARRLVPPVWRRSLKAYSRYSQRPSPTALRHVFEEILLRDDVWNGETTLPGLSSLPAFDSAAVAGDKAAATKIARKIVGDFRDSTAAGAARLVLAARALRIHENLALGDQLLVENRDGDSVPAQIDRFFLTLGFEAACEANKQRLRVLLKEKGLSTVVAKSWITSCWSFQGVSQELVLDALQVALIVKENQPLQHFDAIITEALAIAFQLEDMRTAEKILNSYPKLRENYDQLLPLAAYLSSRELPSALFSDRKRVVEFAELYNHIIDSTLSFMETLREKSRTIAIVGNSPCEVGLGRGRLIDSHDAVARFNTFSIEDRFAGDYGKKCNIHVRLPGREGDNASSLSTGLIILNRADLIYRQRDWSNIMALWREGVNVCAFPTNFHLPLFRELGGKPSSGIAFCALVKAMRGSLPRESCFGFSFIDQVGQNATSAHYFRQARPSFQHRWNREKILFDRLIDSDSLSKPAFQAR
jgi:Glycosyltransferase family 29 (sialyltransferase)